MLRRMLTCPLCGTRVGVPATATAGKRACCGGCGELFRIPGRALGSLAAAPVDDRVDTAPSSARVPFGAFWQDALGEDDRSTPAGTLRMGSRRAHGQPDVGPGQDDAQQAAVRTRAMLDLRSLRARFRRTVT